MPTRVAGMFTSLLLSTATSATWELDANSSFVCVQAYGERASTCSPANPALATFEAIDKLQNPPDCKKAKYLVNHGSVGQRGIGSRFSFYKACLAKAFSMNRVYIDNACSGASDCDGEFVLPWSKCSVHGVDARNIIHINTPRGRKQRGYDDCYSHFFKSPSKDTPLVIWSAASTSYLMRPGPLVEEKLGLELQAYSRGHPDIGIHIRHCDVDKGGEAYMHELPEYIHAIDQSLLRNQFHQKHKLEIKLITDHDVVNADIPKVLVNFSVDAIFIRDKAEVESLRECRWCQGPDYDPNMVRGGLSGHSECFKAHSERAVLDLHVLSEARQIAITWTSNYGQLAADLHLFKHAFCGVNVYVDNNFAALDRAWVFLQKLQLNSAGVGYGLATTILDINLPSKDGLASKVLSAHAVTPEVAAGFAVDAREKADIWVKGAFKTCGHDS